MSNEFRKLEDVLSELKGDCVSSPHIFYVKDVVKYRSSGNETYVECDCTFGTGRGCGCDGDCGCEQML